MADEVVLLDRWPSPYCMRVRIALALKGVICEIKDEDLSNKSTLLLQMNPVHKKVPVLIHNGKPICESLIIVEYIDQVWNDKPSLLPSDPYQRAHAKFWADFSDKMVCLYSMSLLTSKREELEVATKEFKENLKLLEEQLGDKHYFGGEELGFLDVALLPIITGFKIREIYGKFKIEDEFPKLFAWANRCLQKESVSKSIPDQEKMYGLIVEMRKKLGVK
ncbi:glutathione S-transferase U25-like [Arachis duranensis]|uniref:Glutathione S-transferase n=1 Tax=Arachis duranensis TaxID=130453 RepID=A0A6P4AYP7_ARADU|nr:glutathione S-transferase U25-like [Arachis duranensis]